MADGGRHSNRKVTARDRLNESLLRRRASASLTERDKPRVPPGNPRHWAWLWALPFFIILSAGLGAGLSAADIVPPSGTWRRMASLDWEMARWQAWGRASAVVWGYYGTFVGVGFILGAMGLDGTMAGKRRATLFVGAVLAAPLGRAGIEWAGGALLPGEPADLAEVTVVLLPGLGLSALALLEGMAIPKMFEPAKEDFDGRLDPFGSEADFARSNYQSAVMIVLLLLLFSLGGLLVVF
ncbi:MAG: hypothetical protein PWP23_1639 [Candidatus Sumerlaeota bacterium]|nr:hypothetical protein [Candidatus Sumerlaeota bacterium]